MQITNKTIPGFGHLTPNEMPPKFTLQTVSGVPPLTIINAKSAVPENITIYGNTVDGVGVGNGNAPYALPILQTAAVPIYAYISSYPSGSYGTSINAPLTAGITYTIRFNIDSLTVSSGWVALNARNYDSLSSNVKLENYSCLGGYASESMLGTHAVKFTPTVSGYLWLQAYNCDISDIILLQGSYEISEILDTDIYIDNQYLGFGAANEYILYTDKPILNDEFAVYNITLKSSLHNSYDISSIQNWSGIPKLTTGTNILEIHTQIPPSKVEVEYRSIV